MQTEQSKFIAESATLALRIGNVYIKSFDGL